TGASASVNNTTGVPTVRVITKGTAKERTFDFAFDNIKGDKGDKGDTGEAFTYDMFTPEQLDALKGENAEITAVTASVNDTTGVPNVDVEIGGTATKRTMAFKFKNIKGKQGDKGEPFTYDDFTEEQLAALAFKYEDFTPEQLDEIITGVAKAVETSGKLGLTVLD
ncbi:MAG: hypothetical protein IJN59_04445, partial [Oscillospiraceae bacterium]|nr:hypothetical protein [Oscillospiraceae bacterium]